MENKVNKKFKSVRMKLFSTLSLIVAGIILLLIVINSIVLEMFYMVAKMSDLKKEYDKINEIYDNENDIEALRQIKQDAIANNYDILIENRDCVLVFSTNENFSKIIEEKYFQNFLNSLDRKKDKTIYSEENMLIKKINLYGLNSILLIGRINNGNKVYMQIPIASIEKSVNISNNLLIIIGMMAIIITGIVASIVSKKLTKPILELNSIADKMAKLDFSTKYELTDTDDEINELGNSINILSEKLEGTIKQLRNSNLQLERDIEEKSKIDEMRKQFISDVSHELKTPIALIQGYAEGLAENVTQDDESRKYYAEVIIEESNKMDRLVKQLLELMKLEYGKKEFNNNEFNICKMIKNVIKKCNVMLKEKDISDVRFKAEDRVIVYADEFYIEQAFTNYLTNAIKHIKSVYDEKYIEIEVKENEKKDKIKVTVFNTGDTLSEENLERIWKRFYKVDSSRNRADGGSGIGLALVKAIMMNYNCKYGVRNKENGIEFYFEVPIKKE